MGDPLLWIGLGGLLILALGMWLRRAQARFVAGLRAEGDPLADHPETKQFRQRFQAWLFGMGGETGPAPGRSLITFLMVVLLGAAAVWSLLPGLFE